MKDKFWDDSIKKLTPYTPGEQPRDRKYIKLNTNENPYPPSPKVLEAIRDSVNSDLRLYSDPTCLSLKKAITNYYSLSEEQVFVGNGSDEVLAMAFLGLLGHNKNILFADITYSFYPVYGDVFNKAYRLIPLKEDFSIPVEEFLCSNGGIVICNPNAPTGKQMNIDDIRKILDYNKESVVIIDEAYIDFGGESAVPLIDEYPNLLVIQTFSKSRSLAGLRIGFALGQRDLIIGLETVKNSINSYTLDKLAIVGGTAAMDDREYFEMTKEKVIKTRERTAAELKRLGFNVIESKANFLFASHNILSAEAIYTYLKENGILVRYFKKPRIDNYIRISIGTDEEMEALISTLGEYINKKS